VIETNIVKVIPSTTAKTIPKTTGFAEKGAHCSAMSQEKIPYFRTAITAIFKNWTALQLAVNHNAGGLQSKEKAEWMEESLETWFYENKDIEPYEVEEFLGDIIEAEFQLQIDDGSLREVGCKVCEFFSICRTQNQEKVIERLQVKTNIEYKTS